MFKTILVSLLVCTSIPSLASIRDFAHVECTGVHDRFYAKLNFYGDRHRAVVSVAADDIRTSGESGRVTVEMRLGPKFGHEIYFNNDEGFEMNIYQTYYTRDLKVARIEADIVFETPAGGEIWTVPRIWFFCE